jgi:hypothetical protein
VGVALLDSQEFPVARAKGKAKCIDKSGLSGIALAYESRLAGPEMSDERLLALSEHSEILDA